MFLRLNLLIALTACGTTIHVDTDGGMPDGAPPPTRFLEIEGHGAITLVFGEEARVGVRYLDADRMPLVGRLLSFRLEGRAHDTSLSNVDVLTSETGLAETMVAAGMTPAAFRVRVTAEDADPVFIDVAVSDNGFGQLAVDPTYVGERALDSLGVAVFAGLDCTDEVTMLERGDRFRVRSEEDASLIFEALPAGVTYSIAGRGEGPEGDLLAWGCQDGIEIEAESVTDAAIELDDLPQNVRGSFVTSVAFSPAATSATFAGLSSAVSIDGASTILDTAEATLIASGSFDRADAIAIARREGLDETFRSSLAREGVGPEVALDALDQLLEERTGEMVVFGTLRVGDELTYRVGYLESGPTPDALVRLDATTGLSLDADVAGTFDDRGETFAIDRLVIGLGASTLAHAIANEQLGETSETAIVDLLIDLAQCDALPAAPTVEDHCDSDCLAAACEDVMTLLALLLETELELLDAARGRIELRGDVTLTDESADLDVDQLDGVLRGEWTGDASPEPERLDAVLDAQRISAPPS